MTRRLLLIAVASLVVTGCGDNNKSDIPKDLNQPLPPPPVGSGGGGKKVQASQPKGDDR